MSDSTQESRRQERQEMQPTNEQIMTEVKRMQEQDKHWSVDRRVPIALIWTLLAQTAAAVWWASGQSELNSAQERRIAALEAQRNSERLSERMHSLEAQVSDAKQLLLRIDERTQRLAERVRQP